MLWFGIILITFMTVFVAELGDKSQLITISLASRYDEKKIVFLGLLLGTALVTVLSVALGTLVFRFVPMRTVKISAALIFIVFGVLTFRKRKKDVEEVKKKKGGAMSTAILLSIFAEFGDKTQLAIIALTAHYGSPVFVFIGAIAGLGTITAIGVLLGSKIGDLFERDKIDLITGGLFIVIGMVFLIEALFT